MTAERDASAAARIAQMRRSLRSAAMTAPESKTTVRFTSQASVGQIIAMLDSRTEQKVYQWESSNPGGALRVVFAWGKACLWCIGAFVKVNDADGERYMRRILPRAIAVRDLGAQ